MTDHHQDISMPRLHPAARMPSGIATLAIGALASLCSISDAAAQTVSDGKLIAPAALEVNAKTAVKVIGGTTINIDAGSGIGIDASAGAMSLTSKTTTNMTSGGRMHLGGGEQLYLLNKQGVVISRAWQGNGKLSVEGELHAGGSVFMNNDNALFSEGNLNLHGHQRLMIYNKDGVIISRGFGGNGTIAIEGDQWIRGAIQMTGTNLIAGDGRLHLAGTEKLLILNKEGAVISRAFGGSGDLLVEGVVKAARIECKANVWADGVFDPAYRLAPLSEVAAHIAEHRHLPGVPSEREVREKGFAVDEMLRIQMAKIEELTLHAIRLDREATAMTAQIDRQQALLTQQQALIDRQAGMLERFGAALGMHAAEAAAGGVR
jgi:hypothetical protein